LGLDCEVIEDLAYAECDVAVVWGMPKERSGRSVASIERRKFRQDVFARHSGRIVVMEAPVLGRRVKAPANLPLLIRKLLPKFQTRKTLDPFAHYRVGLGGFPDEGGLALAPFCTGRWKDLSRRLGVPEPSPYRAEGRHILVIGQVNGDSSLRGTDINDWLLSACSELRGMTDRPIIVRPHPLARDFVTSRLPEKLAGLGVEVDDVARPLADSLRGAWSVVTFSSGAAVDALIAGIPAISLSPASFAREVTDHRLADALVPSLHERLPWLDRLAAAQWCEDEIARGDVWHPLIKALSQGQPVRIAA
jgi:hypothetical protein